MMMQMAWSGNDHDDGDGEDVDGCDGDGDVFYHVRRLLMIVQ